MTAAPLYVPDILAVAAPFLFWLGITAIASVLILNTKDYIQNCGKPAKKENPSESKPAISLGTVDGGKIDNNIIVGARFLEAEKLKDTSVSGNAVLPIPQ